MLCFQSRGSQGQCNGYLNCILVFPHFQAQMPVVRVFVAFQLPRYLQMKLFSQWECKRFAQKPLNGSFRNIWAHWTDVYLLQSEILAQWLSAAALKPLWCFVWTLPAVLKASFPLTRHSLCLLNNWWKHIIVKNVYRSVLMGIAIKGEGQKYVILQKKQHNCTLQRGLRTNYESHAVEKLLGSFQIFLLLLSFFHVVDVCMKTRGQVLLSNQHKFEIQQLQ